MKSENAKNPSLTHEEFAQFVSEWGNGGDIDGIKRAMIESVDSVLGRSDALFLDENGVLQCTISPKELKLLYTLLK